MPRPRAPRAPKDPAGITDEFKTEIDSASREILQQRIVKIQEQLEETHKFLKEKEEIVKLRDELKMSEASSRETIKHLKNRTRYILQRMRDMGAL